MMSHKKFLSLILISILVCLSLSSYAQGLKVKSPYHDIKVKVTGCEESGNAVLVTLLLENTGNRDFDFSICGGYDNYSMAVDDEGNKFSGENILVKIGNGYYNQLFIMDKMISDFPLKVTMKIIGVPEHATSFSRINLWFNSNDIQVYEQPIMISNLPINRDGDE